MVTPLPPSIVVHTRPPCWRCVAGIASLAWFYRTRMADQETANAGLEKVTDYVDEQERLTPMIRLMF